MNRKLLFLILVGAAFVSTASAQTTNRWSGTPGGEQKWETASEWSLGVPPSLAQSYTVIDQKLAGNRDVRNIVIDTDTVASNAINGCLTISNLVLTLTANVLHVNDTGSATLTILQTLSVSNNSTLIITNSTMTMPGSFPIFTAPDYLLTVDGTVLLEGGTITVGNEAIQFPEIVGVNSSGTLTIAGGEDHVEGDLAIAYNVGSVGTVVITSGELFIDGDNEIGLSGVGSLFQSAGTLSMSGEAVGNGTLTVAGGGHFVGGDSLEIAGSAWVTGGELFVGGDTVIGSGVGSLIQSNGTVSTVGEFVGSASVGAGLLVIAGGTNLVGSDGFSVGDFETTGTVWFTGGSLVATNQAGITITQGFFTQSNGTLVASAEILGGYVLSFPGEESETIAGDGTLTIAGGTQALGFGGLTVGVFAGSTSTVWITGGQLFATSFSNIIGNDGVGSLVQSNGIMEMILSEYVGNDAGGDGTLTVAGGTHSVEDGEFIVGNSSAATGSVWVTGGQLATDGAVIGLAGVGQMTVSNGNWQVEDVSVGATSGGNGTLTVAGGMSVVSSDLTIGTPDCTGTGTVIVAGGSLFVTNAVHNAVLDLENSTLTLSGGTLVADVLVKTNPCGVFQQTGGTLVVGGVTNIVSPAQFSITAISRVGNDMRITWQTPGGVTNIVQATNGGPGGSYNTNFVDLSPQFVIPSGSLVTTNYLDVGGATNVPSRFYRVRLVP